MGTDYPKLDIRRLDPHMSPDLANLVVGDFYFGDMTDHQMRVNRIQTLLLMLKAVRDLGDFEHTGDWDWRIEILHAKDNEPASRVPTDPDNFWTDDVYFNYIVVPEDYTQGFSRWENLTVRLFDMDQGDEQEVLVPVDDIRIIRIYWES